MLSKLKLRLAKRRSSQNCSGAALGGGRERTSRLGSDLQRLRKHGRLANRRVLSGASLGLSIGEVRTDMTLRNPESWAESFSETIYKLVAGRDHARTEMHAWLDMAINVIAKTGFPLGLDKAGLTKAFIAHTDAAKAAIPAHQPLLYQVKDGWDPLCVFLGLPVPADPFPRTNDRGEFWERVSRKK
jgi:hypothetical protein